MEYFKHEYISERVIRIVDIINNSFYLVIGDSRAALIDTGDGFGDLKSYVKKLTDKDVFVILTHGHLDHTGGSNFYDEVYLHPNDFELFKINNAANYRLDYYRKYNLLRKIPLFDFNLEFEGELKPIKNLQTFDLGNLSILMVEVFGHTLGIMIPIILEERIAIFGDACDPWTLLFKEGSTTVSEYRNNLINFKQYEHLYDTVLRNHGTFFSQKDLLDNVIKACDKVLANDYESKQYLTMGRLFYSAYPIDGRSNRLDGIEGNIQFTKNNL